MENSKESLVDQFFNMTLDRTKIKPHTKPKLVIVPVSPPKKEHKKKIFQGTDYALQYQHELLLNRKASTVNCSTLVSGPTHISAGTFVEELPYSDIFLHLAPHVIDFRKRLPIFNSCSEIIQKINEHPVTIIQGSTGCGKSTQVPQYIYDDCAVKQVPCNIIITQPRKIAAITIAHRVAYERGLQLGEQVGYQIGLDRCVGDSLETATQITYCTTGVVLQKLIQAKTLTAYTHIVLDEVHERSVETDLLITIIRRLLHQNSPDTKIILMSATMDLAKFEDFFKIPDESNEYLYPPVIDLSKDMRCYPIKIEYIDDVTAPARRSMLEHFFDSKNPGIPEKMYQDAAQQIALIILQCSRESSYTRTILVFLPGINEIETMRKEFNDRFKEAVRQQKFEVYILHSMLSVDEQKDVFALKTIPKIILSTNISESSITIPNVTHIIDFCLTKRVATGGSSNRLQTLVLDWASHNNCNQRAGRTGRQCPGVVFRYVTRKFFENQMLKHPCPEILDTPLESVILKVKKLDMGSPCAILGVSLDPPDKQRIVDAVLVLKEHGGLLRKNSSNIFEYDDGEITFVGEIMASLPCDVRISKLIIMGYIFSVLEEAIIIAAGLSIQGIFRSSIDNKLEDYKTKLKWADGSESDLIALLNAYTKWINYRNEKYFSADEAEKKWCKVNGLDLKSLNEMRLWIAEVKKRLKEFKLENLPHGHQPIWNRQEKLFALKVVFAGSFGIGNYCLPATDLTCERDAYNIVNNLDPKKTVYFRNMQRGIVGCVYENSIKRALIDEGVIDSDTKVDVTFDLQQSERVFVTFHSSNEDDNGGKITQEVYNAVKLRRLKNAINIDVMSTEDTLNFALDNNLGTVVESKFFPNQTFMKYPELCPLPTCFEMEMKGYITHVKTCETFYFKPFATRGPELNKPNLRHAAAIKEIQRILNFAEPSEPQNLKNGDKVMVLIEDNLERGIFKEYIDSFSAAKIHLMDFGKDTEIGLSDVFSFKNAKDREDLSKYPPLVILCRLQEIKPAYVKGFDDKWNIQATQQLANAVEHEKVIIHVFSVVDDVVSVKLFQKDEDNVEFCWNDKLVADGFAVECEENFVSKQDHEERVRRSREQSPLEFGPKEEFKKKLVKINQKVIPEIPTTSFRKKVQLKGPVSPLEIQVKAIVQHVNGYVVIDGSSVNQILLNDNLKDYRPNLCVAAEMYFETETTKVKLRETTMLPNITGLPALLALIFSPTSKIRRDIDKTRYTSLLFGLGADEDDEAYFPERDSVLDVDFELSLNDIKIINNLRYTMSKLLYVQPYKNLRIPDLLDQQRENLLRRAKELILKIVSEKRTPREIEETPRAFDWNIDGEDTPQNDQDYRCIYEFITCPPLEEMTIEKKKKLLDHAKDLESGGHKYARLYNQQCKLCNVQWNNSVELKLHLLSKLHKTRKEQLEKGMEGAI